MSAIPPDIVKQVAFLARLRLEGDALKQFTAQIDRIVSYVQQLQAVPTEQVEPTSHVLPLSNVLRPDEIRPSLKPEDVVRLAPASKPPFIAIPKVIEG